jgi:hypothetical protein
MLGTSIGIGGLGLHGVERDFVAGLDDVGVHRLNVLFELPKDFVLRPG